MTFFFYLISYTECTFKIFNSNNGFQNLKKKKNDLFIRDKKGSISLFKNVNHP